MNPLRGKRVVVTRAAEQGEDLCRALEARGAQAIRCPTIRLAAPASWEALDHALESLAAYDWVVFTSANGVRFTVERMEAIGLGAHRLRGARVAVVGERTARALHERGVEADFVAADEGVVPLTESLDPVEGAAVLLARSDRADPVAAEILRRRGARQVDDVVAYRTVPMAPSGSALDELRRGIDGITFTSPSTIQGFLDIGPEWRLLAGDAIVATIGPTTTAAVREAGLVPYEAEEKTMTALVDALSMGLARRAGSAELAPSTRLRRLRRTEGLRALVRETSLSADDLILPLFVCDGGGIREEIASMPGVFRESVDLVAERVQEATELGIRAVLLFGVPDVKDAAGSGSYDPEGAVQRTTRMLRERFADLVLIADTCMCEYTDHGHCGILDRRADVDNDATLEVLARIAVSQAGSGADLVAPSGMIDGQVAAIRAALDGAGHPGVGILAYSAKYASAFYGPFRDAAQGAPAFGDRRSHQMDPPNAGEAVREAWQDLEEGADLIMVKPALAYLDVVRRLKVAFEGVPLVAYNVSGEYAMVKAAAAAGWLAERAVVLETLTSMKRAGADLVITYHALDAARWLR